MHCSEENRTNEKCVIKVVMREKILWKPKWTWWISNKLDNWERMKSVFNERMILQMKGNQELETKIILLSYIINQKCFSNLK